LQSPLELCDGVTIPSDIKKFIWSIPPGEKRDLAFVKQLAVAAFGPEILAASSIMGTSKGQQSADKVKRPGLNKHILSALFGKYFLIFWRKLIPTLLTKNFR
jgi:hypothetical protein